MIAVCYHHFREWGVSLLCPVSVAMMRMDDIMLQSNGCGREGFEERAIPDTMWGLDVSPVCRVHDLMYQQAKERARRHRDQAQLTAEEKFSDGVMAMNLVTLISTKTKNRLLRWMRLRRAYKYIDGTSVTDILKVLPQGTLVAMGYGSATEAMEGLC